MTSFTFQTTRSILSEVGASERIGELAAGLGCRRVAFVTDKGVSELGLTDAALCGLKAAGVGIYDEVVADPPEEMVMQAVERARAEGVDGVVSVGAARRSTRRS